MIPKKVWTKPEFWIIDRQNIEYKTHTNIHEATGHSIVYNGNPMFVKANNSGFYGVRSDAVS